MRKSARMQELERQHGRPIGQVVARAIEESATMEEAARRLEISRQTLELWKAKLRIETVRRVTFAG